MPHARFSDMPDRLYAYKFPYWKHPVLRQCFPGRKIRFIDTPCNLPSSGWLILWGMAQPPVPLSSKITLLRMEDGFLRSVGLGADLVRPVSWALDRKGIYYNAQAPSDLEEILAHRQWDDATLSRAKHLRLRLLESGLTKYNTGKGHWQRPQSTTQVILVPGQVESDASIAFGAPGEKTNMGLLRAVRVQHPHAYLLYKPHPDVLARLRKEGAGEQDAAKWCDEIVTDIPMGSLLPEVDEVHVLTSLAGFEALLRGKQVTCYGQPFYAGWGLTRDVLPPNRRGRPLTIDQLVAGALIDYPFYLSRDGKDTITAEAALESLIGWRNHSGSGDPWWRSVIRIFLRLCIGVR